MTRTHTTTTRLDNETEYPTRAQFGVKAWIVTEICGREITHAGYVQLGGGPAEFVDCTNGAAGKTPLVAAVNARATELVVFAAAAAEDFSAAPDSTPTDAEAEAAQRELIEQERQAGVEEARVVLCVWCDGQAIAGSELCHRCAAYFGAEETRECYRREPGVTRPAPAHGEIFLPSEIESQASRLHGVPEHSRWYPRITRPADGSAPAYGACDGCGEFQALIERGESWLCPGCARSKPTTTNASADTDGDELAAMLEAETRLQDAAAFLAQGAEETAQLERLAAQVRARIDCLRLFHADSRLVDLALHVRAPGWHDLPLDWRAGMALMADDTAWLPFQERAAA